MATGGFIKLHRKSLTSEVFADATLWRVWTWMLMRANHKPGRFQGVPIPRGSFATGMRSASEELGLPQTTVHRSIKRIEKLGSCGTKAERGFTVITICNYATYNDNEKRRGRKAESKWNAGGTQAETIEETQEAQETSSPQPPAQISAGADGRPKDWQEVEGELFAAGLAKATEAVATLRGNGCTALQVREVLRHYRENSPAWGVGALYNRLAALRPGQAPDELWPPISAVAQHNKRQAKSDEAAQRIAKVREAGEARRKSDAEKRRRLEADFGGELDGMSREEIRGLIAATWPKNPQFYLGKLPARGSPTGVLREALLSTISESREATRK